jgi:histidinol-phosphate aminotransferase
MVMLKFFKGRDLVVFNPCSYSALDIAKDVGMKIRRLQLKPPEFKLDWESMDIRDSFVIIDYPNNPTGKLLISRNELANLLDNGNLVVVDEAAYEYSKDTFIDLVEKYSNLVITRTLDKAFGLAGFKVSYMVMGDDVLEQIDKAVYINKPACFGAVKALSHREYMEISVVNTLKERKFLEKELSGKGLKVFASKANFVLVKTDISNFAFALQEKQILIEDLSRFWLNGYYRISVGSREENESLIKAIE